MRLQNMSDDDDTEGNSYRTSAQEVNMEKWKYTDIAEDCKLLKN